MKKHLIGTLFLAIFTASINAQELKPEVGDKAVEVNFRPFSSSPISISSLKFRIYNEDGKVFRIGAFLGGEIQKPSEDVSQTTVEVSIRPAFEKHFDGTERLSPYIGTEFELTYKYSSIKNNDLDNAIIGAWDEFGTEQGFLEVGANLIIGADFYVYKKLYLGTEFGFGVQLRELTDIKLEVDGEEVNKVSRGGIFQFGPNYIGALRLGFTF